jgi:hypothetical protein
LLEESAEILLACDVFGAFLTGGAGQGFVFHFEPFQPHDADVFLALLPELALTQFHSKTIQVGLIEHDLSLSVQSRVFMPYCRLCHFAHSDLIQEY